MSCDSCGRECTAACGTRQFRACCFNYLRKRGGPPASLTETVDELDPGLRLELWLARGGAGPQNFLRSRTPTLAQENHHKQMNVESEDYRDERIRSDQI